MSAPAPPSSSNMANSSGFKTIKIAQAECQNLGYSIKLEFAHNVTFPHPSFEKCTKLTKNRR